MSQDSEQSAHQAARGRHRAPQRRFSYAAHVGRVGALAVSLGIGAAVASTPGVAWADGSDDSTPTHQDNDNTAPPESGATATAPSAGMPDVGEVIRHNIDRAVKDIRKIVTGVVRSSGGAHTSTHGAGADNPPVVDVDEPNMPNTVVSEGQRDISASRQQRSEQIDPGPVAVAQRQYRPAQAAIVTRIQESVEDGEASLRAATQHVVTALTPRTSNINAPAVTARVVDTVDQPQVAAAPAPSPVMRVVSGFLAAIGISPPTANTPVAPVSGLTLLGGLELIRRELERLFVNKTPAVTSTPTSLEVDQGDHTTFTMPAYDADGDRLTYTVTDGPDPDQGTLSAPVYNPTTRTYTYTYTAKPDAGTADNVDDRITLTASDAGSGLHFHGLASLFNPSAAHTGTATVNVDIENANDAPVANPDPGYNATEDTILNSPTSLLANDTDADGDHLTAVTVVDKPTAQGGKVTINADGTFTYTPKANFNGTDTFTYTVTDGSGAANATATGLATVTVGAVNDQPSVTNPAPFSTNEDLPLTSPAGSLLAGATDVDTGTTLHTVAVTDQATTGGGKVTINADGTFTYTPKANFNGTDTFTYTVTDGSGAANATATGTATIAVAAVNDAPVAGATTIGTPNSSDGRVTGSVTATDPADGDTVKFTAQVYDTAKGTVVINSDGTFRYTPKPEQRLTAYTTPGDDTDTFTVIANDGKGGSTPIAVTVPVDPAAAVITDTKSVFSNGYSSLGDPVQAADGGLYQTASRISDGKQYVVVVYRDPQTGLTKTSNEVEVSGGFYQTQAVGPDGTYYQPVAGAGHTYQLVYSPSTNTLTAHEIGTSNGSFASKPYFASDGTVYSVSEAYPQTKVWKYNPTTGAESIQTLSGGPAGGLVIGPDGRYYVTTSNGGTTTVYRADPGTGTFAPSNTVTGATFAPVVFDQSGNGYVATTSNGQTTVWKYSQTTGQLTSLSTLASATSPLGPNVSGGKLYVTTQSGTNQTTVYAINTTTGAAAPSMQVPGVPYSYVQFAPDGTPYAIHTNDAVTGASKIWVNDSDGLRSSPVITSAVGNPVVASDGTVYQAATVNGQPVVVAYHPDTNTFDNINLAAPAQSQPVVGADGTVYVLTFSGPRQGELVVYRPQAGQTTVIRVGGLPYQVIPQTDGSVLVLDDGRAITIKSVPNSPSTL